MAKQYVEQHLHGDYSVRVGQKVKRGQQIGKGNGHGAGMTLASHDHISVAEWDGYNHKHGGWFGPLPNKLLNPLHVGVGFSSNQNDKWVFNPSRGLGGYGYLEKTPYNWYTGSNKSLHDGIDAYKPKGWAIYALNDGVVTDVGCQSNGLTYVYIK